MQVKKQTAGVKECRGFRVTEEEEANPNTPAASVVTWMGDECILEHIKVFNFQRKYKMNHELSGGLAPFAPVHCNMMFS